MLVAFVTGVVLTAAPTATAAAQDLGPCVGREADPVRSDISLTGIPRIRGRISLDLMVVNADRVGQGWRVVITHNGPVVVAKNAFTRSLGVVHGELPGVETARLRVFKVVPNLPGVDRFALYGHQCPHPRDLHRQNPGQALTRGC